MANLQRGQEEAQGKQRQRNKEEGDLQGGGRGPKYEMLQTIHKNAPKIVH